MPNISQRVLVQRFRALPRWGRRVVWGVAGVLALWLVSFFAVPPLAKFALERIASDKLGRAVSVERIAFSPWSLELAVHGLKIAGTAGTPQLEVGRIYADLELQSLVFLAPVIDAVAVEGVRAHLAHLGGGRYDIDDILERLAKDNEPDTGPPRFSVFNITLKDGALDFRDTPVGATHQLREIALGIPFLSNIGARRTVLTHPHLAFKLNGNAVSLQAATTPFAPDRHTDLVLATPRLDLAPYLRYWPASFPLRPHSGHLVADLKLSFVQEAQPRVSLSGKLALEDFAITEGDAPLASAARLALELHDVRPLARQANVSRIALEQPVLHLRRDAKGALTLATRFSSPQPAAPAKPAPAWAGTLQTLALTSGTLHWDDRSARTALAIDALEFEAHDLRWPMTSPARARGSLRLGEGTLAVEGSGTDKAAHATLKVQDLPLELAGPYLKPYFAAPLAARATLEAQADYAADSGLLLQAPRLDVSKLAVGEKPAALRWENLRIEGVKVAPASQTASIERITLSRPDVALERNREGHWMFENWLPASSASASPAPATTPAWSLALGEFKLEDGAVNLKDEALERPAQLGASAIQVSLREIKPLAAAQAAMPLAVSFELARGRGTRRDAGKANYTGTLRLPGKAPLRAAGALRLERLPLAALKPYFSQWLNLDLLHADLSHRGQWEVSLPASGPAVSMTGDVAVEDLRANTLAPSEPLLEWHALNLRGVKLALVDGALKSLVVNDTVLSDYFARVIIDANGRLNLQDLVRAQATPQVAAASATVPTSATAASTPATAPADIRFGPISLVGGRVLYADRFIQPNYSATLTELSGSLGSFASAPPGGAVQMADLALRGRAEGTATLEVSGKLNPLAKPLALDIKGEVRGLELPPLSPYSAKYAGYGIERGKLSMNVAYRISPEGKLDASNQIILNQLQFGEQVKSPDAPNLPVKLAVALLADRNGVIDINLPISGSINDPQFKLGPTIVKLIFNLIGKALISPFSLLASAFGGGEEMSQVAFPAGVAVLDDDTRGKLTRVADALANRPALQVGIVGQSDLARDQEGWRRARLASLLAAEKRRRLARDGVKVDTDTQVAPAEIPALLKAVYKRADIAKPRNAIGLTKDLPDAEMEALLLASMSVSDEALRELALARGVAVRDFLAARGIAPERLFLGAVQVNTGAARAALTLSVR